MKLSEIKGEQAFKTIGKVVGCLRKMFSDEELNNIVQEQKEGWVLVFLEESLERKTDIWCEMYLALNPGETKENISVGSVISFAYEFKNDEQLMSLFFSQGEQIVKTSIGSPMENTEAAEKM